MSEIFARFNSVPDVEWLKTLLGSLRSREVDGVRLPGFPPEAIQSQFVGNANEQALCEGFLFYHHCKTWCASLNVPLTPAARILDFGMGWGRMYRFFLKDVPAGNLYGVDVDPDILDSCRQAGMPGNLGRVAPQGPTEFASDFFDLVFAYSVFSHLPEWIHLKWLAEFSRILKPGGVLVATTEARHFIDFCATLIGRPPETLTLWHQTLATAFPDPAEALRRYDAGEFVYAPTGGGAYRDSAHYGEAVIPRAYVAARWTKFLQLKDFLDDSRRFGQAVVVMQKGYV